jgi:tetratricopeptide (TPR) repeat protein/predicted Ser/Thr protein kinase
MSHSTPTDPAETPTPSAPEVDALEAARVRAIVSARLLGDDAGAPDPVRVGRFVLLERLAQGGMGVVWAAYDPQLDRKVAVKLLRGDHDDDALRGRIVREAQAMAKVSHPNVTQIFEAGASTHGTFIAMEFVAGETLRAWQRRRHSAAEVLDAYVQAARGLAAAHEAGIVHRDFKPDNAMFGSDGRVRVLDFGLARAEGSGALSRALVDTIESPTEDALRTPLTYAGAVLGTPAYMAPEQILGESADARSDQFAFCVALWEALFGARPFEGSSAQELFERVVEGERRPLPSKPALPRSARDALTRGLDRDPAQRHATMHALIARLQRDPARRRRRSLLVGATAVAASVGAFAWWQARAERCSGALAELAGVWDDERRAAVDTAVLATELPYAEQARAKISAELDDYATRWAAMHTESCLATNVRAEQSAAAMDLRMACLRRAKLGLAATTDVLATAEVSAVEHADELLRELVPLERCADVAALQAEVEPPDADEHDAVEAVQAELAGARARLRAGDPERARARLDAAKVAAAGLDYRPLHTELDLLECDALDDLGRYDEAEAACLRGFESAGRLRQWRPLQRAAQLLMRVVGLEQERGSEAMRYYPLALALAEGSPELEATVISQHATILEDQGRYEEAVAQHREAIDRLTSLRGAADPALVTLRSALGSALLELGQLQQGEQELRRALEISEAELGSSHPLSGMVRHNLARAFEAQERLAEAEAEYRRAIEIKQVTLGTEHVVVLASREALADVLSSRGRATEAEAELRSVVASFERALGGEHPRFASALNALAVNLATQGRNREAVAPLRRALTLFERQLGVDNPRLAGLHTNLAIVLDADGRKDESLVHLRRAVEIRERTLAPDHIDLANARINLASVLVERSPTEVLALTELALPVYAAPDAPKIRHANALFVRARALWATARDGKGRREARAIAEQAHALFSGVEPEVLPLSTFPELQEWLKSH